MFGWELWKKKNGKQNSLPEKPISLPEKPIREFSFKDLKKATNNFDKKMMLGQGCCGVVYKGVFPRENVDVAVKKLNIMGVDAFFSQLTIINGLRHRHLVRLLGWCRKKDRFLLVYEFIPNGSLDNHLCGQYSNVPGRTLNWECRSKIIAGVASALHYLHNEYDLTVVYSGFPASSIMLDSSFNARLGGLGLVRVLDNDKDKDKDKDKNAYTEEGMKCTLGYLAPECFYTGKATTESDVFGFGAVVMLVVCGHRPYPTKHAGFKCLVDWVWYLYSEGHILEAVDERLHNEYDAQQAERLLLLGLSCCHPNAAERPKTPTIVQIISGSLPPPDVPPFKPAFIWPPMGFNMESLPTDTSMISVYSIDEADRSECTSRPESLEDLARDDQDILEKTLKNLGGTTREFSFRDLKKATNNFDQKMKLGQGGCAVVYKGVLPQENIEFAVKKFSRDTIQRIDDFLSELTIINRLSHKHLVGLIGWCHEKNMLLLVYDFMPNGSLDNHLFGGPDKTLNWECRCTIIEGVASALYYLHDQYEEKVVHRDLKASNVMLDSNFNARLGDLGLARALDKDKNSYTELKGVPGTPGYMAPECFHACKFTTESDVFGFGAVVFEVVCARRPWTKIAGFHCLVDWVWWLHREGRILEAVDEKLHDDYDAQQAKRLLLLGLACSHPTAGQRPKTPTIVQIIAGSLPPPDVPSFKPVFVWQSLITDTQDVTVMTHTDYASARSEFSQRCETRDDFASSKSIREIVVSSWIIRTPRFFDIFINHRGKDTKRNVAALLYDRFVHLKLYPFLDYKSMSPGDQLSESIESAICSCKVAVVVFSPHYCNSYYCLHELALMMEWEKKVIPIFYDVNPSDLLVEDGRFPPNQLHRFRLALKLAKARVGITFDSGDGNWSDLLKRASDIVVEILSELDAEERHYPSQ